MKLHNLRALGRRTVSIAGLGFRRTLGKATGGGSNRLLLSITGVAVAIMLLITVSGVALGMASQNAVQSDDVDYWVVPEGGNLNTIAVSTGGPQLGDTHRLTDRLQSDTRVEYATPVLLQVVPVQSSTRNDPEYVLFIGVIVPETSQPVIAGQPTDALQAGDPYFANGTYNGTWTGEAVINPAAADVLNVSAADPIEPVESTPESLHVQSVSDEEFQTGVGVAPIALVHLSELQAMSGSTTDDAADQLLVSTNDPSVRNELASLYPNTTVVTRTGIATQQVSTSSLPVAMAVAALVIAVLIGVLFTATMMGLEVTHDRSALATLTALGYSERSLAVLVVTETMSLAVLGGLLGVGLGVAGILITNAAVAATLDVPSLAVLHPALFGYGFGVALCIGIVAAPYPIWLSRRAEPLEVMRQ